MLVGTVVLGSTLAASINLNDGGPVEFGQGVTQTTACDSEIIMTPYSKFYNEADVFAFSGIRLSQVDTTDQSDSSEGCAGKSFLIKLYEENGDVIDVSFTIAVSNNGLFSSSFGDLDTSGENGTNSSITLTFELELLASDVYTITIESSASAEAAASEYITTCNEGSDFSIGEYLEDGGIGVYVFLTPNCSDNNTGDYFAVLKGSIWKEFVSPGLDKGKWCEDNVYHGINGTEIGDGEGNTAAWLSIYATCPNYSPMLGELVEFRTSFGTDWFIPSKMEMLAIYNNLGEVNQNGWKVDVGGGFYYMTSTESDSGNMWTLVYESDELYEDGKMNTNRIVPVVRITSSPF